MIVSYNPATDETLARFAPLDGLRPDGHAADLSGVAPAWLGLAECDPLVDAFVICPNGKFMATLLADGTVALHNLKPILQQRNFIAAVNYQRQFLLCIFLDFCLSLCT